MTTDLQYYVVFYDDYVAAVPESWINKEENILRLPPKMVPNRKQMSKLTIGSNWSTEEAKKILGPFDLQIKKRRQISKSPVDGFISPENDNLVNDDQNNRSYDKNDTQENGETSATFIAKNSDLLKNIKKEKFMKDMSKKTNSYGELGEDEKGRSTKDMSKESNHYIDGELGEDEKNIPSDDESNNQPKSVLTKSNKTNVFVENPSTSATQRSKIKITSNVPAKQNIKPVYIEHISFATKLLQSHKASIAQQASNAVQINMIPQDSNTCNVNDLMPLQLLEENTGQLHCLLLSPEDHNRALTNAVFAEHVLNQHKEMYLVCPVETELDMPLMQAPEDSNTQEEVEEQSTSNASKGKSIRCSWNSEQVLLLLTLYEKFGELYDSGKITNRQLFKEIVEGMDAKGYNYNISQCTDKIENLKKKYKEIYDHNAKSGNNPKTFEFYERLNELFGKKPWIRPLLVAGSNIPGDLQEKENRGSSSNSNKRQKLDLHNAKLDYLKDAVEDRRLRREALAEYRTRKLESLENFVNVLRQSTQNNDNNNCNK